MAQTPADISAQIRAQLKVLDPTISADPITPERKIIDTVAEVMADNQIDYYVLNYAFDIDTKVGSDLDQFVGIFGFARQAGRAATGIATFQRSTPADQNIFIDSGTQIIKPQSPVSPAVVFFTTAAVVLAEGTTEVDAPIQAASVGPLGNVASGTITTIGTGTDSSVSVVTNNNGTTGGSDPESDAELRVRFKNTIFRNVAGTEDQYLALSIASSYASKANVIGPQDRFEEWVQVPSTRVITSQIPYSKYTYSTDYYLTDGDPVSEIFYASRGIDYSMSTAVPPVVTINSAVTSLTVGATLPTATLTVSSTSGFPTTGTIYVGGQQVFYTGTTGTTFTGCTGGTGTFVTGTPVTYGLLQPGVVALLEHTYCSINSRNDPANNILNYVDVFVSGQDAVSATEVVRFPSVTYQLTATTTSPYYVNNFKRVSTGVIPTVGNFFMELLWQPVVTLPSSIVVQGRPYYLGTDYFQVADTTTWRGSRRGRDGIEWTAAASATIGANVDLILGYTFDRLPLTLNEVIDQHKQITTDVLVHSANERFLNFNLIAMYRPGFSKASVDAAIQTALEDFLDRQLFGTVIQISDVIDIVHQVPGIDNVRLAIPNDGIAYGIQEVAANGITPVGAPKTTDFFLQDSDLPVLNRVLVSQRSQNTW